MFPKKGLIIILFILTIVLPFVQAASLGGEEEDRLIFVRTTSEYVIKTDVSREIVDEIEQTIILEEDALKNFFQVTKKTSTEKPTILLFKNKQDYLDSLYLYMNPSLSFRYATHVPFKNVILMALSPDHNYTFQMLKHEWVHHFFRSYLIDDIDYYAPVWFEEGIAEYISSTNLTDLYTSKSPVFAAVLRDEINFRTLRPISEIVWDTDPDTGNTYGGRYPEYWGLVNFLINYDRGQYRFIVTNFINSVKEENDNANEQFLNSFSDLAKVQEEWKTFIMEELNQPQKAPEPTTAPVQKKTIVACSDTDLHNDPFSKGTISSNDQSQPWHGLSDYCANRSAVVEINCDPEKMYALKITDCTKLSAVCLKGACVEIPPEALVTSNNDSWVIILVERMMIYGPLIVLFIILIVVILIITKKKKN